MLKSFPDLPPIWAVGVVALSWALARWLPIWSFQVPLLPGLLFWGGLLLIGWSAVWFWRKRTPIEPGHTPKALITEGPYRINRNPIYTGLAITLLGYALGQGAVTALLPPLAFPFIITARFIRAEEDALRQAFGAEAEAWIAATRRW